MKISLYSPKFNGNEIKYLKECIKTNWLSSSGKFVKLFEKKIKNYTKSKFAVACVNGTAALQIGLRLAGVKANHEVIVPTITFIAPINAVRYNGANPIFMDCDEYCNLDIKKTIDFIKKNTFYKRKYTYNKKTKKKITALIAVHVFGNPVKLYSLIALCKKRNIKIIEDSSESFGSKYIAGNLKGKHTGTVGYIGCLSFNLNKVITSGGGGMILTNNKKLAEQAKYLLNQAKDDPINFVHNSVGYNFGLTNLHAAIGCAQFEKLSRILLMKKKIYLEYKKILSKNKSLNLIGNPQYSRSNYWMNYIKFKKGKNKKNEMIKKFLSNKIEVRPIWKCNHLQKPYINSQKFKITKAPEMVNSCLCLPSSYFLNTKKIKQISKVLGK